LTLSLLLSSFTCHDIMWTKTCMDTIYNLWSVVVLLIEMHYTNRFRSHLTNQNDALILDVWQSIMFGSKIDLPLNNISVDVLDRILFDWIRSMNEKINRTAINEMPYLSNKSIENDIDKVYRWFLDEIPWSEQVCQYLFNTVRIHIG
jgi:hypothetical protein